MRSIAVLLLLASLLTGLANVALLPPFEGFDEHLHFSYLQQNAKTGTWPRFGDGTAQQVESYLQTGPSAAYSGGPVRYSEFFARPDARERAKALAMTGRAEPPTFRASTRPNWEAQQPPLYYALLSPLYLVSETWSVSAQLALLRGFSYALAWLSLCVAATVFARFAPAPELKPYFALAPALWPFLFPGWFPEMGRIGNDSLVALMVASSVALVCDDRLNVKTALVVGLVCGLGALTKATFLPVLVVIAGLITYQGWQRASWRPVVAFGLTVLGVAGWWYVLRFFETGMLFATSYGLSVRSAGGLQAAWSEHGSIRLLAYSVGVTIGTFLWSGTWSFARPPIAALAPLLALASLIGIAAVRPLTQNWRHPLALLASSTFAIFSLALIHASLLLIALGTPGAPGWYLHALAPAVAPIVGFALYAIFHRPLWRTALLVLLCYSTLFLLIVMMLQTVYFAGCGSTLPSPTRLDLASMSVCWQDWRRITDNIAALAYPGAAAMLLVPGIVLAALGIAGLFQSRLHAHPGVDSIQSSLAQPG